MQRDSGTYCDEPPDAADYAAWRSSDFDLASEEPRIAALLAANALVGQLQERLVPLLVEREEFWARYFYRRGRWALGVVNDTEGLALFWG
jgi:hypothetical protein